MKTIAISGGMDPVHFGHMKLIHEAAQYGKLIVILNTDEWLVRKKGYAFMPWEQRAEVLRGMRGVYKVIKADDKDDTVCKTLAKLKPDYFANGGDRDDRNTPELEVCERLGIKPLFGIGGDKIASSSGLVNAVR